MQSPKLLFVASKAKYLGCCLLISSRFSCSLDITSRTYLQDNISKNEISTQSDKLLSFNSLINSFETQGVPYKFLIRS